MRRYTSTISSSEQVQTLGRKHHPKSPRRRSPIRDPTGRLLLMTWCFYVTFADVKNRPVYLPKVSLTPKFLEVGTSLLDFPVSHDGDAFSIAAMQAPRKKRRCECGDRECRLPGTRSLEQAIQQIGESHVVWHRDRVSRLLLAATEPPIWPLKRRHSKAGHERLDICPLLPAKFTSTFHQRQVVFTKSR